MQKSLAGLYRGLLHDLLKSCPELIAKVMPSLWSHIISTPWLVHDVIEIPERDIRVALTRLFGYQALTSNHRFCRFIDGVDEFEETAQCDHRTIVEIIKGWTLTAPESVKLYVSSREYNIFMNSFSADSIIRLHELTKSDMERFCQERLSHIGLAEDYNLLAASIVQKAQGIFLWAALVSTSIRRQFDAGASIAILQQELESLPDELDGLCEYIL